MIASDSSEDWAKAPVGPAAVRPATAASPPTDTILITSRLVLRAGVILTSLLCTDS